MAKRRSVAASVDVLCERMEAHAEAMEQLLRRLEGYIEKNDTRFREIERFQWKAIGALTVISVVANWLLAKL